jgi:hypothetical protein
VRGHITLDCQNNPWESKYCDSDEMTIILTAVIIIGSSALLQVTEKNSIDVR